MKKRIAKLLYWMSKKEYKGGFYTQKQFIGVKWFLLRTIVKWQKK